MDDTARMLVDTAERLFETHCQKDVLIAAETGEWPAKLWNAVEEAGLTLALVPEDAGGVGLSASDALAALRVSARHAAPIPLAETLLASWLLSQAGLPVPSGPLTVAPVASGDSLAVTKSGSGMRLDGLARRVPFARHVSHVVALAEDDDGHAHVAIVERDRCTMAQGANVAREPRDTIEEVIEPYLIQLGLVARTARGRCLNGRGWTHLGLPMPEGGQAGLFDG